MLEEKVQIEGTSEVGKRLRRVHKPLYKMKFVQPQNTVLQCCLAEFHIHGMGLFGKLFSLWQVD